MLILAGTLRVSADGLDRARPAMQAMIEASRAEPGCLAYSYAQDVLEPGLIHVHEAWTDRAALDAHFASAHIVAWRASWPDIGVHDRRLKLYETPGPEPI
jgi:quinol monooxygenase YgiN